ncbi:hypothetical protein GETHLI_20840 [Geothrix limicola]|uniref:Outer membrane protein beta-barrel domain-containing protein n=1 Tax=Geothrix limicola TaxID=2927978 RepID=A0ABQ5QFK3_9BACT|nr:hypothetical protein [Geothrix limicola]GLH73582.1 hypothetical protein GETHLI_20840 [Geothrix limicola]
MRRLLPLLLLPVLPLSAQSAFVSVIRQPHATAAEFTTPVTEIELKDPGSLSRVHLGVGLGLRHWDDGTDAFRFIVDANATAEDVFLGFGAVAEARSGDGGYIGPRLRVGWAFHPNWALSLEGEHLEKPFADGTSPKRHSALGLVLTVRF